MKYKFLQAIAVLACFLVFKPNIAMAQCACLNNLEKAAKSTFKHADYLLTVQVLEVVDIDEYTSKAEVKVIKSYKGKPDDQFWVYFKKKKYGSCYKFSMDPNTKRDLVIFEKGIVNIPYVDDFECSGVTNQHWSELKRKNLHK